MSADVLELALGTISGRERSRVLSHVETCTGCQAELASLAAVTDATLSLAPEAEPPVGFESRVLERFHAERTARAPRRRRRAYYLAAAAVLLAVTGFALGTLVARDSGHGTYSSMTPAMARLTSNGHVVGQVFLSPGNPTWIYMTLDDGNWSGVARCEVTLTSGRVVTVGRFTLSGGYGAWVAPVHASADHVRTARLVDAHGTVIASAALHV
jgi:hypothetical protein